MARFNLDQYMTVAERVDLFWQRYPSGRLSTELVHFEPDQCVVRAEVYADKDDEFPITSNYAEERLDSSPVNRTSMVENCATSALGRAIGDLGSDFTGAKRPSREEMAKVERLKAQEATQGAPEGFADQLAGVESVEALHELWEEALKGGYSQTVVKEFSARKRELGG
jgi:hypothetical protein